MQLEIYICPSCAILPCSREATRKLFFSFLPPIPRDSFQIPSHYDNASRAGEVSLFPGDRGLSVARLRFLELFSRSLFVAGEYPTGIAEIDNTFLSESPMRSMGRGSISAVFIGGLEMRETIGSIAVIVDHSFDALNGSRRERI